MKMGYLKFNFHTLVMLQFVWAPGSKQILIRPFQKCTVHVCSLNDSKVMKRQSSRPPKKIVPRAFKSMKSSFCKVNRLSSGGLGSIPGVPLFSFFLYERKSEILLNCAQCFNSAHYYASQF